jgi:hypothetical protein
LTKKAAHEKEKKEKELLMSCATLYHEQLMSAQSSGSSLPGGTLRKIILEETNKEGLPENTVKIETIRSRVN